MREGLILGSHGHCAALSANIVAGNAPVNPTLIQQQLLLLLEDGETVEPIPCTNHAVLWRESLLDSKIGVRDRGRGRGRVRVRKRESLLDSKIGVSTLAALTLTLTLPSNPNPMQTIKPIKAN